MRAAPPASDRERLVALAKELLELGEVDIPDDDASAQAIFDREDALIEAMRRIAGGSQVYAIIWAAGPEFSKSAEDIVEEVMAAGPVILAPPPEGDA